MLPCALTAFLEEDQCKDECFDHEDDTTINTPWRIGGTDFALKVQNVAEELKQTGFAKVCKGMGEDYRLCCGTG